MAATAVSEFAKFPGVGASWPGQGIFTPGGHAAQASVAYPPPQPIWRKIDNKK